MANLVLSGVGGKMLAVVGSWGSGKSTVIHLLQDRLRGSHTHVITFDAWAHQGDPLRYAFLEELTTDLVSEGWLEDNNLPAEDGQDQSLRDKTWEAKLKRLRWHTQATVEKSEPTLTWSGIALAIALFIAPIALALLVSLHLGPVSRKHTSDPAFWLLLILSLLPLLAFVVGLFFADARHSLLAAFVGQPQTVNVTTTEQEPETTTVEFQKFFGEVLKACLAPPERRLVLVVDNLDRVEDDAFALSVWSTMRTFLSPDHRTASQKWAKRLWVVVPVAPETVAPQDKPLGALKDREGLERMDAEDPEPATSQRFDKVFQASYVIPPPVLTRWKQYMEMSLAVAIPNRTHHPRAELQLISSLYAATRKPSEITPRGIRRFANMLGAYHRLWEDVVPLPVQALAVVLFRERSRSATDLLQEDVVPRSLRVILPYPVDELRLHLASLYFGVPQGEATQLLWSRALGDVLSSGKFEALVPHMPSKYFADMLSSYLDGKLAEWTESDQAEVWTFAMFLREVEQRSPHPFQSLWGSLLRKATSFESVRLTVETVGGLSDIIDHAFATSARVVALGSTRTVMTAVGKGARQVDGSYADCLHDIWRVCDQHEAGETWRDIALMPEDAPQYLSVLLMLNGDEGFLPNLPPPDASAVVAALSTACTGKEQFDLVKALKTMLAITKDWQSFDPLADRLASLLSQWNAPPPAAKVCEYVEVLLVLRHTSTRAAQALQNLAPTLFSYLATQGMQDEETIKMVYRGILWASPQGPTGNPVGNSPQGFSVYQQLGSQSPDYLVESLADAVRCGSLPFQSLVAGGTPLTQLRRKVASALVRTDSGAVHPDILIKQMNEYLPSASDGERTSILEGLEELGLDDYLAEEPYSPDLAALYIGALGRSLPGAVHRCGVNNWVKGRVNIMPNI